MPWSQNYDPLGAWPLSTAVAALPVVTLFFVLVGLRARVWVAAFAGMVMAIALALAVFGMPAKLAGGAVVAGVVFGFLRIAWIIIASIFLYHVAVETGQFAVMKRSIARLSSDRRIQAVLIAFCFGAFLEGTGGGGAPVAIAGAFLIGLGFKPFEAAVLCLIANTAPVAWGGVGNPIRTLAGVTGPARVRAVGDGRTDPAAVLADPPDLAGADDDRLVRHLRGAAGAARGRRLVRRDAVSSGPTTSRSASSTSPPRSSR